MLIPFSKSAISLSELSDIDKTLGPGDEPGITVPVLVLLALDSGRSTNSPGKSDAPDTCLDSVTRCNEGSLSGLTGFFLAGIKNKLNSQHLLLRNPQFNYIRGNIWTDLVWCHLLYFKCLFKNGGELDNNLRRREL